ncbi:biopolymer transporter ExbD [soil metagenome]
MNFRRDTEHHEVDFDLTAMIDVVFLLIIFFTFSTVFTRTMAKAMDLPKEIGESAPPSTSEDARTITIDVAADGALTLSGAQATSRDELIGSVRAMVNRAALQSRDANIEVIIRADRAAKAVHVNRLAAALSRAGVRTWKLATAGEGGGGSAGAGGGAGGGGGGS